jgi:hypothetical protein
MAVRRRYYYNPATRQMQDEPMPDGITRYGRAPIAIMDSMPKTYHEGIGRHIESRSEWKMADEASGSITFGSVEEPARYAAKGREEVKRAIKQDRRRASETALGKWRADPKEVRQKIQKRAEEQHETMKKSGLTKVLNKELKAAGVAAYDD